MFDSITTLIGPNGTGKSTVLRALDWFFNGKQGSISDKDCTVGASDHDIVVRVTFSNLTANDRQELGKYAPPGASTFTAWKRRAPDGSEILSANAKSYAPFNEVRQKATASEKKHAYSELRGTDLSLKLPAWTNQENAVQAMTAWEAANTDALTDAPETLQTNFFGFNSGGKMSGLFDFVLVTADLRASEESVDGRSSIISRILERSIDRAAADEEISRIVEESRLKQQQVYADTFKTQLASMTTQLNELVATYSPGRTVKVSPADVELKAPRTTFNVAVLDGVTETTVDRQGHGFQRTLLISALQLLAQSGAASTDGVICLAIEEPELFQHPIQAQAFAKVLRSLAEDLGKKVQIAYATHSPYFVEARHFHQVRRLCRSNENPPQVTVHDATVEIVKAKLEGVLEPSVVDRQLDGAISNSLAVALFADSALLVEGPTDAAIFLGIGDRESIGSLEAKGISLVPVGGKMSIPLAHAILSSLGIPVHALFDADSGQESRSIGQGKPEAKIQAEKQQTISENRKLLKYFGHIEEDFPAAMAGGAVSAFEDNLEAFLYENWPEWADSCRAFEIQTGITLKKSQHAYRNATQFAEGTIPAMLRQILTMAGGN